MPYLHIRRAVGLKPGSGRGGEVEVGDDDLVSLSQTPRQIGQIEGLRGARADPDFVRCQPEGNSDLFSGFAHIFDPATATDMNTFIPDASNDDTIDLGSAGQGWLVGGVIRLVATSAAVWHCEAFLHGDGTLATPFE